MAKDFETYWCKRFWPLTRPWLLPFLPRKALDSDQTNRRRKESGQSTRRNHTSYISFSIHCNSTYYLDAYSVLRTLYMILCSILRPLLRALGGHSSWGTHELAVCVVTCSSMSRNAAPISRSTLEHPCSAQLCSQTVPGVLYSHKPLRPRANICQPETNLIPHHSHTRATHTARSAEM